MKSIFTDNRDSSVFVNKQILQPRRILFSPETMQKKSVPEMQTSIVIVYRKTPLFNGKHFCSNAKLRIYFKVKIFQELIIHQISPKQEFLDGAMPKCISTPFKFGRIGGIFLIFAEILGGQRKLGDGNTTFDLQYRLYCVREEGKEDN